MPRRLLSVTAHTTLDHAEAVLTGEDFSEASVAVVDATTAREAPDCVSLKVEVDNLAEANVPAHLDEVRLSPEQARTLAADLERHADRVEGETESDRDAVR